MLTCLDVSCSGDTLTNSAHHIDGALISETLPCWQNVFATHWRHGCVENARIHRDHITSAPPHFVNIGLVFQCVVGSAGASPPTSPQDCCLWPADRYLKKIDAASRVLDKARKDFIVCESCHHVIVHQLPNLVNPVFFSCLSKSRLSVHWFFVFACFSRFTHFCPQNPDFLNPVFLLENYFLFSSFAFQKKLLFPLPPSLPPPSLFHMLAHPPITPPHATPTHTHTI